MVPGSTCRRRAGRAHLAEIAVLFQLRARRSRPQRRLASEGGYSCCKPANTYRKRQRIETGRRFFKDIPPVPLWKGKERVKASGHTETA